MIILVLGALLIVVGVSSISFPELVNSLKENDHQQWKTLGSPPSHAFSQTIGVFSWVLSKGYEQSASSSVIELGSKVFKKALIAKYLLLSGVVFLFVGFTITLINA